MFELFSFYLEKDVLTITSSNLLTHTRIYHMNKYVHIYNLVSLYPTLFIVCRVPTSMSYHFYIMCPWPYFVADNNFLVEEKTDIQDNFGE